jgi:hypothetical protein
MKGAFNMHHAPELTSHEPPGTPSSTLAPNTRWLAFPFRFIITAEAALIFAQSVFAGQFLSGTIEALSIHRENADIAAIVMLAAGLAAVPLRWVKRGVLWEPFACLGLFGLIALQITLGKEHVLAIHIPLGVTIIVLVVLFAIYAWRPLPFTSDVFRE